MCRGQSLLLCLCSVRKGLVCPRRTQPWALRPKALGCPGQSLRALVPAWHSRSTRGCRGQSLPWPLRAEELACPRRTQPPALRPLGVPRAKSPVASACGRIGVPTANSTLGPASESTGVPRAKSSCPGSRVAQPEHSGVPRAKSPVPSACGRDYVPRATANSTLGPASESTGVPRAKSSCPGPGVSRVVPTGRLDRDNRKAALCGLKAQIRPVEVKAERGIKPERRVSGKDQHQFVERAHSRW